MRIGLRWVYVLTLAVSAIGHSSLAQPVETMRPRVWSINYNPIIESHGSQRLHQVAGWNHPEPLNWTYRLDMNEASHGIISYRYGRQIDADVFPLKADGFRYTDNSYMTARSTGNWHSPDGVDYQAIIRDYDLARMVDYGVVDEVIVQGAPYFGYWESTMAGKGGYWCNSSPQKRIACSKIFILMGFNYERGSAEMIHAYGHRAESIMSHVYDGWNVNGNRTLFDRFGWNYGQTTISNVYGIGSVHYPCNGDAGYDYGDTRTVTSYAPDWMNNFPNLTGATAQVSRATWGGPDYHRNFMKWWYQHMPHVAGRNNHDGYDRLNNWWEYLHNFNAHPESGGDLNVGGPAPAASPNPVPPVAVTAEPEDAWLPQINDEELVVWTSLWDHNAEVFVGTADGAAAAAITSDNRRDESPRINALGQIVFQRFDGQDYEIYTINADGTNLTQITNNTTDDWHADINDAGRIVWDGWDGNDYEIYSANVDGSDIVQVTDNHVDFPTKPRDDVWPKINNANRIAWFGYDGFDWEVFSANGDGTDIENVSDNWRQDEYPQISDTGRIVWTRWHGDTNAEIYSAEADGSNLVRLTNNYHEDWHPQISAADQVVWMSYPDGDWEIYSVPAAGGTAVRITNNSSHDQYPQVDSEGRIVWQGFDGADWEIYAYDDGTILQLSDNDYDDRAPVLNETAIAAWHGEASVEEDGITRRHDIFTVEINGCAPGDGDRDGDVDVADFVLLEGCLGGPVAPAAGEACGCFDAEVDGDVDLRDYADFQGRLAD